LKVRPPVPLSLLTVVLLAAASCRTPGRAPLVQPGAPGQPTREIPVAAAVDRSGVRHTAADVRFMQGMIGHHAQALEMTALLPSRTSRDDMKLLAQRIEVSQADEIRMMQHWLKARGEAAPDPQAHHHGGAPTEGPTKGPTKEMMPGMLSADDMARLSAARGPGFDRLFLEFMIKHHDGALVMVKDLLATPGAGQEPDIFAFASDVEADQRMEMDRMSAMLVTVKELHQ
jgi:uncharacterized protein (DUF305 family)